MKIKDYEDYFQLISENYDGFTEFHSVDINEFQDFFQSIRSATGLVMVLESYTRAPAEHSNAELADLVSGSLVVLDKFDPRATTPKLSAMHLAEEAILQIRAKMVHDHQSQCGIMQYLKPNSLGIVPVYALTNEWAGFRMEFSMEETEEILPNGRWKTTFNTWGNG